MHRVAAGCWAVGALDMIGVGACCFRVAVGSCQS